MQNRLAKLLFISALFLLVFVALFLSRAADDNSLFSWSWVFAKIDASKIYLILIIALVVSLFLSRRAIPDRYQIPFLAVLSFSASLPFWQESEIIVDASRYFTQAKHLEVYGIGYFLREWGGAILAWTDLPLVPFLYGLIFKLFGENRIAIQLFTTMLFSLTTVLTYSIGKMLWNQEAAFSAGLLLLGIPYLLTQVPLMLVDVPTMFFLTLTVFTFLIALHEGGAANIACSISAIVCTVLTKYSAWFMLSVLGIILIAYAAGRTRTSSQRPVLRGAFILLIAAAISGSILLFYYDVVSQQITLLREYQKPGFNRWGESFSSTFLFQIHPFVTLSALASLVIAIRKRDANYAIVCWLVLLVVLFSINRIRYILPVFPLLTLMAGYGLQVIKHDEMRRFVIYGTVTTSLVIAIFAYLPLADSMSAANLKQAGASLNRLSAKEIVVITLPPRDPVVNLAVAVPLLDLFTDKGIQFRYEPDAVPPRQEIEQSSLRFTWEYLNPAYYATSPNARSENTPLVVLSDASNDALPMSVQSKLEGYRLSESFRSNESIFRYTIFVRIYQK